MKNTLSRKPSLRMAVLPLFAISLGLTACGGSGGGGVSGSTPDVEQGDQLAAKIRRSDYGIVHIEAQDNISLGFGYAYAFAQDNLCAIADSYVTVNGERSKYFGPENSWEFTGNGTVNNNLNSDFFFKLLIAEQRVENLLALAPPAGPRPEVRELISGYVKGYNRYLQDTGVDNLPDPTCRGAEWVREISEMDVYRRFYQLALLGSSAVAIDGIGSAQPPGPDSLGTLPLSPEDIASQLGASWKGVQIGSNAIALGSEATQNGRGMLLGNPHFPWNGTERFYQAHLTIPGELDVTGGSLFGVPLVLIGYNKDLAWSHTVSSAWRFTPYRLQLVPGQATSYLVDGQPEDMTAWPLTVEAQVPDGGLQTVERTLYTSRWGPVFTSLLGLPLFPWLPTEAYAMADANATNFRYVNHFWETNRASSSRELLAVLERNQGIPWVNTIAADSAGEALYADISVTPNVSDDMMISCGAPLGLVTGPVLGLPVLDGSRSTCAWLNDDDAIQAGTIGPAKMPHLFRRDYVTNSNDSYWLSNPNEPLEGFARIIGDEGTERTMRTRLGLVMVEERLSGSDGLPGNRFTRQQLQDLLFNDRQHAAELWLDDLLTGCVAMPLVVGTGGPVQSAEACAALSGWDRTDKLDSPGALLFRRFAQNLFITTVPSGTSASQLNFVDVWTTPFDVNNPVYTPSGLNVLNPHVNYALGSAISDLQGAGKAMDESLRTSATESRGAEIIPIHGGPGSLGVFNAISNKWDAAAGYTDVVHGASYVQVVSFDGDACPDARTILTYSQSTNPDSPHFADQTRLYSQSGWVRPQFCESELQGKITETLELSQPLD
ncbi:acylase [Spongiibacter sp. KMU-158]|uniref:Acylase n=1 Tax=Spongiibacter pelagi TaxID=2760804 RepID=A0A927GV64_9GAMM|nr:acylase [Spongiibacter pelagi]MBD2858065.1 acylase [Spongiibacter pelagi]